MADVARKLTDQGLGAYMLLGRGEANTGGADKSSILADGMESLLGAVYLHHGIDTAREVILRLFGALLDAAPTLGAGWIGNQPAGADRGARPGRAVIRGDLHRAGPRQGVHRRRRRDGHRIRLRNGPIQEGSRAKSGGGGVERAGERLS
ncbi:ribonuclease 3 [Mycobacterium xenopi 3993]|nr:ribonuclease 3 [Mycobacterium xenopi 3993]